MKITPVILKTSNCNISEKKSSEMLNNSINFSGTTNKVPLKKYLAIKFESIKLNIQRIISDFRWNRFMKEINKDVEKMSERDIWRHYD